MPVYAAKTPLPSIDKLWRIVNGTIRHHGYVRHASIEALHSVRQSFGYQDDSSFKLVAASLKRAAEPGFWCCDVLPFPKQHGLMKCSLTFDSLNRFVLKRMRKPCMCHSEDLLPRSLAD